MRSKFETKMAKWLNDNKLTYEYEPFSIDYLAKKRGAICTQCASKDHVVVKARYTPDFVVDFPKGQKLYVETKGRLTSRDRTKILAILDTSGVINRKNFRLVLMYDNWTTKLKTQRYSEWAEKNGIQCVTLANIKKSWLKAITKLR